MERSLLDTDTFSEVLRGRNADISSKADAYLSVIGRFTLSATSIAELIDGLRRQGRDEQIASLVEKLENEQHEILSVDLDAALTAGHIFGDLHRTGQPIGRSDPFIAAIALREDLPLVTGNTKHFQRIQALGYALKLETWHGRP
jgi:tRNA(fMet)-specific endonuclease VapC